MKAITYNKYGPPDVLQYTDVEKPVPKAEEVLVKIHASSINRGNLVLLSGKPFVARVAFGIRKPKFTVPGGDFSGVIEAVGNKVTQFKPGNTVFGDLSGSGWGAFAEYAPVPAHALTWKPESLSFAEAAALPMAGVTALQALRDKGQLESGEKVLLYGASGGVGTFLVQLAKYFGAEVTAVCSTKHKDLLMNIGADHVIDYTVTDFSKETKQYDLIIGVNGSQPLSVYKRALKSGGRFVHVGGSVTQLTQVMLASPLHSRSGGKQIASFLHRPKQEDLEELKVIAETGCLLPVIDRTYALSDIREAFHYFTDGHVSGKVSIAMN
ncbi:NAD(P)-dependent alcohol dehydrogenase [Terribacillus saccharophilus]|uniref:NAD(P)-dependent alcohol dehydrogenase n=1 Tax=Terribacillus saccharophilus TaxID=361277 RepID=UPI003982A4F3